MPRFASGRRLCDRSPNGDRNPGFRRWPRPSESDRRRQAGPPDFGSQAFPRRRSHQPPRGRRRARQPDGPHRGPRLRVRRRPDGEPVADHPFRRRGLHRWKVEEKITDKEWEAVAKAANAGPKDSGSGIDPLYGLGVAWTRPTGRCGGGPGGRSSPATMTTTSTPTSSRRSASGRSTGSDGAGRGLPGRAVREQAGKLPLEPRAPRT